MLVRNKKAFSKGMLLILSFFGVFAAILTPFFKDDTSGKRITGLQYADQLFNELSKGSSYFIPAVQKRVDGLQGKEVTITVTPKKADLNLAVAMLEAAGVKGAVDGNKLTMSGDLAKILSAAVADSDKMYHNDSAALQQKYSTDALKVTGNWWSILSPCIKELQKQGKVADASVVDAVVRRAVEPGHNFYSVKPTKVMDNLFILTGMLVFYVIYTMWYGFGVFELFDGIGLTMTKAKSKQEA